MVIYCRSHHRRPIRKGVNRAFRDVQAEVPAGWCETCGAEVFLPAQRQCLHCRSVKGENHP